MTRVANTGVGIEKPPDRQHQVRHRPRHGKSIGWRVYQLRTRCPTYPQSRQQAPALIEWAMIVTRSVVCSILSISKSGRLIRKLADMTAPRFYRLPKAWSLPVSACFHAKCRRPKLLTHGADGRPSYHHLQLGGDYRYMAVPEPRVGLRLAH